MLAVEVRRHRGVGGIAGVLLVDHLGHALHGLHDLSSVHDAVVQPVGHVLGGDAQGGAVFHQADVVDVGHLGAADALVDPADDVAEDALGVVVEFRPGSRSGVQFGAGGERRTSGYRRASRGQRARQFGLTGADVDLVVVDARAGLLRSARAPRRCRRRPWGGRSSGRAWPPSGRAWPTCPCRSGPGRAGRSSRPISTFQSS